MNENAMVVLGLIAALLATIILAPLIMLWVWNGVVVNVFNAPSLLWWQAFLLYYCIKALLYQPTKTNKPTDEWVL